MFLESLESRQMLASDFGFAHTIGGTSNDVARAVAVDSAGNSYVAGDFRFAFDIDPGPDVVRLTETGGGSGDVFVAKYRPDGSLAWARSLGGGSVDQGIDIAVDPGDNVVIGGKFIGSIDIDPGSSFDPRTATGSNDLFVLKLDSNGNYLWGNTFGSATGGENLRGISVDSTGNVYATGQFNGSGDFDPSPAASRILSTSSTSDHDVFISKFDTSGSLVWATNFGTANSNDGDEGLDIAVDSAGFVYTSGRFRGNSTLNRGAATGHGLPFSSGSTFADNPFVTKHDAGGNLVWAKAFLGTAGSSAEALALDAAGNVVVGGAFQGTIDMDPSASASFLLTSAGDYDSFVTKLDGNGNLVWARRFGGSAGDRLLDLTLNAAGQVVSAGQFGATVDFDPGTGAFSLTATSAVTGGSPIDVFVSTLDGDGSFARALAVGGGGLDRGNGLAAFGGDLYITGEFTLTADFDPGPGVRSRSSATGELDGFLLKLVPPAPVVPGSISGVKWLDADGDGIRDAGEAPLANVVIYIDQNNNGQLDGGAASPTEPVATTDASGGYTFTNLQPGDYSVREIVPSGYVQTSPDAQRDYYVGYDPFDNHLVEIDAITGVVNRVPLLLQNPNTDFHGVVATRSGEIYGLDATTGTLYSIDRVSGITVAKGTAAVSLARGLAYDRGTDTIYGLALTAAGYGLVVVDRETGAATSVGGSVSTSQLSAPSGLTFDRLTNRVVAYDGNGGDFWAFEPSGVPSLLGVTFISSPSLAHNGASFVTLSSFTSSQLLRVTPGSGTSTLLNLSQSVTSEALEFVRATPFAHNIAMASGANVTGVNFGNQFVLGEIRGTKWNDGNGDGVRGANETPMAGIAVYIDLNNDGVLQAASEPNVLTQADGSYAFTGLAPATYVVREIVPTGYHQTAPGVQADYFYGYDIGSSRNQLIKINAVTGQVMAIGPGGGAPLTGLARTNSGELFGVANNALYRVDHVTGTTTQIGPAMAGLGGGLAYDGVTDTLYGVARSGSSTYLATFNRSTGVATVIGTGVSGINNPQGVAWNQTTQRVVVYDNGIDSLWAFDRQGNGGLLRSLIGMENISLAFNGSTYVGARLSGSVQSLVTVDSATGAITPFATMPPGVFTSTLDFVNAEPFGHVVNLGPAGAAAGVDFGNQRSAGDIAGSKWNDADGDGVRDDDEAPMAGIVVYVDANNDGQLQPTEISAITDANGNYLLSEVPLGVQTVREILPPNYRQTSPGMQRDSYYAIDFNQNRQLVRIDAVTGQVTRIGTGVGQQIVGLALTNSGDLYGISPNQFFRINLDTGLAELIGPTLAPPGWGLSYDSETDTIWGIATRATGGNGLVRYDRATGAAIPVGGSITTLQGTSGIAFDSVNDRTVVFDNSDDEFWAFDRSGNATRLTGSSPGFLNNFNLAHNGSGLVMYDGNSRGLHVVNPVNNFIGSPFVVLSEPILPDALEFANVEPFAQRAVVQAGQTVTGVDFGNQSILGEISGSKWNDADGDGIRDPGEGSLAGVTVYLDINHDGALQGDEPATQTAADGSYAFTGIQPGSYQVREILPADYRQTSPGKLRDYYYAIDSFRNFQLVKVDSVTGAVTRIGANGTGVQITGIASTASGAIYGISSGQGGQLYSIDTTTGVATRIGALGRNVGAGLAYDAETDTLYTVARDNSNNFALASVDRETGGTAIIGTGVFTLGNPVGVAFDTLNDRIVVLDSFDRELVAFTRSGIASTLGFAQVNAGSLTYDGSNLVAFESSSAFFAIQPNGSRQLLTVSQEQLGLTTIEYVNLEPFANTVFLPPAGAVTGVDFGNQLVLADISGTKWNDWDGDGTRDAGEPGMAGLTVYLDLNNNGSLDENEPATETGSDGDYLFADVQPGTYFVREVVPFGYQQSSPGAQEDFYYAIRFRRELHKVNPTTGQSTLIGFTGPSDLHALVQTNAGELYALSGPENTLWRIDPTTGAGVRIGSAGYVVAWGLGYDASTDTIYGLARPADGNPNLINLVTYDRESGRATPIGAPIAGLSGTSGITFDPIGQRIIAFDNFDREFYAFTPEGVGTQLATMGFGTGALTTDALGRVVFESGGRLLAVNPDDGQTTVLAGFFPNIIDGLEFINNSDFARKVFVSPATDVTGVDFGNEFVLGEIRGTKWNDLDQDGERDENEPGLAAIQIYLDCNLNGQLEAGEPVQLTDENGNYVFSEVLPGNYVVREVVPDSFVQSAPGAAPDYFYGLNNGRELVQIEAASGLVTTVGPTNVGPPLHGLVRTNSGELFAVGGFDNAWYSVSPTTGQATLVGQIGRGVAWGLAYDPISDTIYGLVHPDPDNNSIVSLATYDRATGQPTVIGPAHADMLGTIGLTFNVITQKVVAFDNEGRQVWAFDRQGNRELLGSYPNLQLDFGLASNAHGELIVKQFGSQVLSRLDLSTGALILITTLSRGMLLEALEMVDRPDFAHEVTVGKREIVVARDFGNYNPAPQLTTLDVAPSTIDEDGTVTLVGAFADVGAESRTVRITWGDGSEETLTLSGSERSFTATHRYLDDGENRVRVEVVDSAGNSDASVEEPDGTSVVSPIVTVANVAPAAAAEADQTEIDENGLVTLTIDVSDVGTLDSHTVDIDWGDGSPVETIAVPADTRTLVVSHRYLDDNPTGTASDSYTVSVIASDDDGAASEAATVAIVVSNVAPEITSLVTSTSAAGPAGQGQATSISGLFADLGSIDTHTVSIAWGDGQTNIVSLSPGSRVFAAQHVYATGGIYTVTATVMDDDGGQDVAAASNVVQGVGLVDGVLYVIGTSAGDHVSISRSGSSAAGQIRVNASFLGGSSQVQFNASAVERVVAYLGDGGDHVSIAGNIDLPALIDGGAGHDHLHGGRGPGTLVGGEGNDHLHGGGGRDILIGGNGADHIHGNTDDDLLIAGTTAFDTDLDALLAIAAEWMSSRSYLQRIANLSGSSGTSDRLNGDVFLQASGMDRTVFDDLHSDHLHGSSGLDWFFASLEDDHVHNSGSEQVEPLE